MKSEILELVNRGSQLSEEGKYEEALICFEKALAIAPNSSDIWNKKGVVLRSLGRYDEAIECFHKSLHISPRDLNAS